MQAEQTSTTTINRRSNWSMVLLALLGTMLIGTVGLLAYFLTTAQPMTHLPRIVTRSTSPQYMFSINVAFPTRVAVSGDGRQVYVIGQSTRNVGVFDRQGTLLYTLAPSDATLEERSPGAVGVAPDGRVLVTDVIRHVVDVYSRDGEYQGAIHSPDGASWDPVGLTFDAHGNTYVADGAPSPPRIVILDDGFHKQGEYQRPSTAGGEVYLAALALDAKGRLFANDTGSWTIDAFGPDRQLLSSEEVGEFDRGNGLRSDIAVDSQDRLYSVDSVNAVVSVYDLDTNPSKVLFTFGDQGTGEGVLGYPMGIATDVTGRVYIADPGNRRVQVWQY